MAQSFLAGRCPDSLQAEQVTEHPFAREVREEPEVLREVTQPFARPLGLVEHRLAVERGRA